MLLLAGMLAMVAGVVRGASAASSPELPVVRAPSEAAVGRAAYSWTADGASPAINYRGRPVVAPYLPKVVAHSHAQGRRSTEGRRITQVHASRSYAGNESLETALCWNGAQRCVPMVGSSINTQAFNGLDPLKPFYLVHTVVGTGALAHPLYVKGVVAVWYGD
jgi:hypothetical protein